MTRPLNLVRSLRVILGASDRYGEAPFRALSKGFEMASQNVRYFYLASALFVWMSLPGWHQTVIANPPLEPVWLIAWATSLPMLPLIDALGMLCASAAILGFWKPGIVSFRALFAVTLLLCAAIPASMGAINHGEHEWFWVAFVFIFLPAGNDRQSRLSYCLTFATAQGLVLTFYTLAGFWKTLHGFAALIAGVPGNFSPGSLSWTVADRMMQTGTQPLLAPFFIENGWLAGPMFLFLIYAQLVAVAAAFRPSLHIVWGGILILFHTGTFALMEIAFPTHIFFLMLLLVASPFQRPDWFQLRTLTLLPIFGGLLSRFRSIAPAPASKSCAT